MTLKHMIVGLALALPAATFSADAFAFEKCDKIEDAAKKEKCEAKEAKQVAKLRAKTTPYLPSSIAEAFKELDAEDKNPFNTDDRYLGVAQTGIKPLDELVASVNKIQAAVSMANYIGDLHKAGKTDEATKLATVLLPELIKLKDEVKNIQAKINEIKSNPAALAKDDPKAALKIPGVIGPIATQLPSTIAELPGAISAVTPLAKGAGGAAVDMAGDAAKDAAGGAMPK